MPAGADLLAFYEQLRTHDPVHWHEPSGAWLVTRHADVSALLIDDRLSSRTIGDLLASASSQQRREAAPLIDFFDSWLVLSDGAMHASLRKALAPAMSGAWAATWAKAFDELAASAFVEAARSSAPLLGEPFSMEAFAGRFASAAISAMLGIADDERADVLVWSGELLRYMAEPSFCAQRLARATDALRQLRRYSVDIARSRTRWQGLPTLLSGAAELPEDAFLALFAQLVAGGAAPVARTLTTAGHAVCRGQLPIDDPSQRARLIEEALRFDPPFHLVPRIARDSIRLSGRRLRDGARVLLVLASANRDEAVFDSPDRFLPQREGIAQHLSFGRGRHRCVGPAIARLELDRAVRALTMEGGRRAASEPVSPASRMSVEPPGLL